jgi:hypothetical protein
LEKTVENNQGRWAWELLQNAKDSIADYNDKNVSVKIELHEEYVEFSHNGMFFTEQDVRGIINQISSKELQEEEPTKKTGRFGTGFLTTHLLSKKITISGILKAQDNHFYKFQFLLDRDGKTISELTPKIEKAWVDFQASTERIVGTYVENAFNTKFSYPLLTTKQKDICRIGVDELMDLMPFVLVFNPKIKSVEIIDNLENRHFIFEKSPDLIDDLITPISIIEKGSTSYAYILSASDEKCSIATEVEYSKQGYSFKTIQENPKLFCDFPLIGTEKFHFPVILNSFFFNPQTERDGIWLKDNKENEDKEVQENQGILLRGVNLFISLINTTKGKNYFDFYHIANTQLPEANDKHFDDTWFKANIQAPLRKALFEAPIVELENGEIEKDAIKELWFPLKSLSTKSSNLLWQFTFDQFPTAVCKLSHLPRWQAVSWDGWNKLTYAELIKDVEAQKDLKSLASVLGKSEQDAGIWINELGKFVLEDEANLALFEKSMIIPNKYGVFGNKDGRFIDEIKDNDLIKVLALLGHDWNNILLNGCVGFGRYHIKDKKALSAEITLMLKNISRKDDRYIQAITILSEWFENNQESAKDLFAELYRNRAELFMNTIDDKESLYKIMRSKTGLARLSEVAQEIDDNPNLLEGLKSSNDLAALLQELNVNNIAELKQLLNVQQPNTQPVQKLEITQDILIGLGVTSLEQLQEALKDTNLAALFNHTSTHEVSMFIYAQTIISRAKANIIAQLRTLPDYDCTDIEELAPTVIGGIKKQGLPIHIVIRPSDNNQVIVYYSSEKDTLDYANAELWIDNGHDTPSHLTLGKILKTTGINKIPV